MCLSLLAASDCTPLKSDGVNGSLFDFDGGDTAAENDGVDASHEDDDASQDGDEVGDADSGVDADSSVEADGGVNADGSADADSDTDARDEEAHPDADYYVNASAPNGGDGSWDRPFKTITDRPRCRWPWNQSASPGAARVVAIAAGSI